MVKPPRIGLTKVLTSTCNPPSAKHASASVSIEPPETMTSMNAPISHGSPMLGSTLVSGVTAAPATADNPLPIPKVKSRTRLLSMPSPCASVSFMMTARVLRPSLVPVRSAVNKAPMRTATGMRRRRYPE